QGPVAERHLDLARHVRLDHAIYEWYVNVVAERCELAAVDATVAVVPPRQLVVVCEERALAVGFALAHEPHERIGVQRCACGVGGLRERCAHGVCRHIRYMPWFVPSSAPDHSGWCASHVTSAAPTGVVRLSCHAAARANRATHGLSQPVVWSAPWGSVSTNSRSIGAVLLTRYAARLMCAALPSRNGGRSSSTARTRAPRAACRCVARGARATCGRLRARSAHSAGAQTWHWRGRSRACVRGAASAPPADRATGRVGLASCVVVLVGID